MKRYSIAFTIFCCLLVSGCRSDLSRITSKLKVGMTKEEVTQILGKRGTLRKQARGITWHCGRHAWEPKKYPDAPHTCWLCKQPGSPTPERWYLYAKSPNEWGAVCLAMVWNDNERLNGWGIVDMQNDEQLAEPYK